MAVTADSLVDDCLLSQATSTATLAAVDVPTLVLDSQASTDDLTGMAANVASHIPHAQHRSLPGDWHGVDDHVLATELRTFLLDRFRVPDGRGCPLLTALDETPRRILPPDRRQSAD